MSTQELQILHRKRLTAPENSTILVKGKGIPLQALTGPEGSRKLRRQDFKKIGT
jgi:hypothetical protein